MEVYDENCRGPVHLLSYFPDMDTLGKFSAWYGGRVSNPHLSTQRVRAEARKVQEKRKNSPGCLFPPMYLPPLRAFMEKVWNGR